MDNRITTLAENLVNYSCQVKPGDKVYVHYTGDSTRLLAKEIVKKVYEAGGVPFVHFTDPQLQRAQLMHCTKEQMELMAEVDSLEMSHMDCYIAVRGSDNITELSDVPAEHIMGLRSTMGSVCRRPAGSCYVIRTMPWRSFPAPVRKRLKTSISMYAIWITAAWRKPWARWWI